MRNKFLPAVVLAAFLVVLSSFVTAQPLGITDRIDITYQKFVLANGLTLIVHEDHQAPIVAINVWYHVGSKNEKPGKTGFAHLFEHLMFNGSENYDDDYVKPLQKIGVTSLNGSTNMDRTNYYEVVPTSALDLVLWLESDRMGHLKGAISQAKLDEQRGVVENELREGLNQPYGIAYELMTKGLYPSGHPYSWPVVGTIEDLDGATLSDVRKWFETYYGPNNAVIAIAGDVDAKTALDKVTKYFGDIAPLPPISRQQAWIAKRNGVRRETTQARIPQSRIRMSWNIPQWGSEEGELLKLGAQILSNGLASRLYKRLIYDEQIATSAFAYARLDEIGGIFTIQADAKPGVSMEKIEKALNEELARFIAEGPTPKELEQAKIQFQAKFIRGIEKLIGRSDGTTDVLLESQVFGGSPEAYKDRLRCIDRATTGSVRAAAAKWLSDGAYILTIHPYPQLSALKSDIDRKTMPLVGPVPDVRFPVLRKAKLSNGLKIILAERHNVPLVNLSLVLDAGFSSDPKGMRGISNMAMNMLTEGTADRTALQISDQLTMLGASLGGDSGLDVCSVSLDALKDKLDPALDIFADVVLNPSFPEAEIQRTKARLSSWIDQAKTAPDSAGARVLPSLVYGKGHAYGVSPSGIGDKNALDGITRSDLMDFHKTWFKADHATLIVVGDTTLAEITPKLESVLKDWKGGPVPPKDIPSVPLPGKQRIYLIDKPGSQQSVIFAAQPMPPANDPSSLAVDMVNLILGGEFLSRINMNIREDKHWSYGAHSTIGNAKGQRLFTVTASVQIDKTKEAMAEVAGEITGILGGKPITDEEFENSVRGRTLGLSAQWQTISAVMDSISEMVEYGLPDDYYQKYPVRLKGLSIDQLTKAAGKAFHPESLTWLVVGDVARIEPGIRELGYGEIMIIDADGDPVRTKNPGTEIMKTGKNTSSDGSPVRINVSKH